MFLAGFLPLSIHCIQDSQRDTTGHSTHKLPTFCHHLCHYMMDILPKVFHSFLHCYLRFRSQYLCHGHFFLVFHFFVSLWSHNIPLHHHFFFSFVSLGFFSLLFSSLCLFFSAFSAANLFFSSSSFLRTSMASSEVRISP